jgi:hypothetical protein
MSMLFCAIWVIPRDCCNQSLEDHFITHSLAFMMMKGVANMESTMLASTGLSQSAGIN